MRMSSIFSPWRWEDTAQRAFQRLRTITAWVLAEWVRFLIGWGLAVLCGVGGVLGLAGQRVGDVGTAGEANAVVVLRVFAFRLLPVEPRGLGPGAHRAVQRAAVAETAAKEGAR